MAVSDRLPVILQEFVVLRNEQGRRFDTIDKMTNYILLTLLGISGAAVTLSKEPTSQPIAFWAIASLPVLFAPLIFSYLHNELMIYRIGKYIHGVLAKQINAYREEKLLGWDEFNVREAAKFLSLSTALFRNLILVLPVAIPLVICLKMFHGRSRWANILLGADAIVLIAIVAVIAYKGIYFVHVVNGGEKKEGG